MNAKKKKIGILGGISLASTIEYYRTITDLYYAEYGDYYYPEILIDSLDFQYFTDLENTNNMPEYRAYILKSLACLKAGGAELAIMAANSPHSVLPDIVGQSPLPILSIVDCVGEEARARGMKKLLLTGIRYTMKSSFYPQGLAKYGIEVIVPNDEEKDIIDDIIFSELVIHRRTEASRQKFLNIIHGYDVDGVILGCTELPQLIDRQDTETPLLNSLLLHCRAVLREALQ